MIEARATAEGTRRFAGRAGAAAGHFREGMGLTLSSLGLGTYLGDDGAAVDAGYEACIAVALGAGINVFDSAINYRGQKSERAVGRALAKAFAAGRARRDEVFVSTKGGYFPHDADDPRPMRRYVQESFLDSGLAPRDEIAQQCHSIAPAYLRDQVARSLANLGLQTIDLYYLHNVETQLGAVDRETFRERMRRAIETLEEEAAAGRIAAWGLATWDGLRVPPEHPDHLSLAAVLAMAKEVGGAGASLPRGSAAFQSPNGPGHDLPLAGNRAGPAARHAGRPADGPGGVRFGVHPAGPSRRRRAARGDLRGVSPASRRRASRRSSSPVRRPG